MKKTVYGVSALAMTAVVLGSSWSGNYATASVTEAKEIQVTAAPAPGEEKVSSKKDIDKPDEEELVANRQLKEVMAQWEKKGEYPDYFGKCVFYGDALFPVIQLTDVSEETKEDFYVKTGVKNENGYLLKHHMVEMKYPN